MNNLDHDYAAKKITGTFIAFRQIHAHDDYPAELDGVDFDATDLVLELSLDEIQALVDDALDYDQIDQLIPDYVRAQNLHDSYKVANMDFGVEEFFGVKSGSDITEEMLEQARQAHNVGKPKTYTVTVNCTEVRYMEIEVEADNVNAASRLAQIMANNMDFYAQSEFVSSDYSCDDVKNHGPSLESTPSSRPKP